MNIETVIELDRFRPREYQSEVLQAIQENGYKKVLLNWHRRCLSGDTHILMSNGSFKFLRDIKVGDNILSWDGSSFVSDIVKNAWKTEAKPTKAIQSSGFLPIITSSDHVFAHRLQDNPIRWDPIKDITPRRKLLNYAGLTEGKINNPDLAEFLGYMLCDGYVSGYQQPKFTNCNLDILKRVEFLAKKLFNITSVWRIKGNGYDLGLTNGTRGGGSTPNKIKELFRSEGLDVPKNKRSLPSILWELDNESLGRFFSAIISADGSMYIHKSKQFEKDHGLISPTEIIFNCGQSYEHGWGIYWLLRKIGIKLQVPYHERKSNWKIRTSSCDSIKKLLSYGPIYGKTDKQQEVLSHLKSTTKKTMIHDGCFISAFTIKNGQSEELYDIETEKYHNFIANGYVVHNSGKDVVAFNIMMEAALEKTGVYFYCLPTYNQGRKVIWDGILSNGMRFLDFIPHELISNKNNAEMKLTLKNGSIIQVVGSDNAAQTLVGTNPQGVVFSEWAIANPEAYTFIRPALVYNNGWAIFVSTPRGRNHFYEMHEIAANNPKEWFISTKTVADTGVISLHEIAKEKSEGLISEDMIEQEYNCSFSAGVEGSFYFRYINKMRLENRITHVPFESAYAVNTAWDIGYNDLTVIIWYQIVGRIVRVINIYSNNLQGMEHYAKILREYADKYGYQYGKHWAPHDIAVHDYGTGQSRIEKAKNLGINFQVHRSKNGEMSSSLPNLSIEDGIEAVRSSFEKMWIDDKNCISLIKALESYRREWDSKKKLYRDTPLHDINSHFADCFKYLVLSLSKTRDSLSPEDLDRRYAEAMQGNQHNVPRPFQDPNSMF